MYGKLFLMIVIWQTCLYCLDNQDSISDFRGIKWGSSPGEVKNREKSEYLQQSNGLGFSSLSYKGNIGDLPARIDYSFRNDSLAEGSYSIEPAKSFRESFSAVKKFLYNSYGKPDYANINALDADSVWTTANPGILYNGPQYFWEFLNGFISLYSSKFITTDKKEQITIIILFVPDIKISDYSESRLIPLNSWSLPNNLRNRADP